MAKVTQSYVKDSMQLQGLSPSDADAQAYAASLQLMLQAAGPGFEKLAFEAEPSAFIRAQRGAAP